jgi:hypothetical protein
VFGADSDQALATIVRPLGGSCIHGIGVFIGCSAGRRNGTFDFVAVSFRRVT